MLFTHWAISPKKKQIEFAVMAVTAYLTEPEDFP